MTREEMLTDVIRKWGFEHRVTIRFANACEKYKTERAVKLLYRWSMAINPEIWDQSQILGPGQKFFKKVLTNKKASVII